MIDFACKTFEIEEVIKCGLSLTKSDYNIMEFLIKNNKGGKEYSSNELSRTMNLDLSTVQRALKKLNEKNIIIRSQKNLHSGGYVYSYRIRDKSELRKILTEIIDNWSKKVKSEVEKW